MDDADDERLERDRRRRPVFFPNHSPRAGWTGPRTVGLVAIAGLVVLAWAPTVISFRLATDAVSAWPVAWTALAAAALVVIAPHGAIDFFRERTLAAALRRHPTEPWLADHRWDPRGETRSAWSRIPRVPAVVALGYVTLLLAVSLAARGALAVAIAWLVGLVFLTPWAVLLWKTFGVGSTRVGFTRFPYLAGERVTLTFGAGSDGARFERIGYRLRLLVEGPGLLAPWHRAVGVIELTPSPSSGVLPGPDQDVEVSFDVPAGAPGAHLSVAYPRWWVLDVAGMTSSGPYSESFLVPIYEKPAAPAA